MKVKLDFVEPTDVTSSTYITGSSETKFLVTSPFKVRIAKATELPEVIDAAMDDLLFAQAIDPIAFKEAKIKLELLEN